MSKSENMLSEGLFSPLTNTPFIVSSGQTLCLDSPVDAEEEHEEEARIFPLSKTTA